MAIWTLSRKSWIALSVDFPYLKPFWASVRILIFVMKATSLLYITFLEFLRRRVREMWVYNFGYILRPPFYVNVWLSRSLFYQEKYPSPLKHYMSIRGFFIHFKHFSDIKSGTPSIPAENFPLRSSITFSTSSSDTGIMKIVGEHVFNCDFLLPLYYPTPRWLKAYNCN